MPSISIPVVVGLVGAVLAVVAQLLIKLRRTALPKGVEELPGPRGVPLVGNLAQLPPIHTWLKFKEWADQYGPIYKISLAGTDHVIVSSEKIANDLMRERGNIYSDRDHPPMAATLLSGGLRPLFMPYGEGLRDFRKFVHQLTMPSSAVTYEPLQEEEALRMVHDLLQTPSQYEMYFERYAAGVIMRLAYGITLITGEEESLQRVLKVVRELERIASPGTYLVDTFPSLMKVPDFLAPFKREGKRLHAEELDLFCSLIRDVDIKRLAGDPSVKDTWTVRWLENRKEHNFSLEVAA